MGQARTMFIYKDTRTHTAAETIDIYVGYLRALRIYEFKCGTLQPRLFPSALTVALKFMAVAVVVVVIITC